VSPKGIDKLAQGCPPDQSRGGLSWVAIARKIASLKGKHIGRWFCSSPSGMGIKTKLQPRVTLRVNPGLISQSPSGKMSNLHPGSMPQDGYQSRQKQQLGALPRGLNP